MKEKVANENFFSKYKWPIVIGVIALIFFGWIILTYNSFIALDQNVTAKWSEVENQYQRQADLIPNLISTVSSALTVETKFVTDVTTARTQWMDAQKGNLLVRDTAGAQLQNSVAAYMNAVATAENYPVLQANKNYIALQDEITGTQNRIAVARGEYIKGIQSYNTAIKMFPGNVLSGMFGFSGKEYYAATVQIYTPQIGSGTLP